MEAVLDPTRITVPEAGELLKAAGATATAVPPRTRSSTDPRQLRAKFNDATIASSGRVSLLHEAGIGGTAGSGRTGVY